VDRPEGAPLPRYEEELDTEPATDHLSFALGVALGRFGSAGEGVLDPATADLSNSLPHGLCFLDGTLASEDLRDSLGQQGAMILHQTWATHGMDPKRDLRSWLRERFFGDVHKKMYEGRPIHWPLSSANKTFVAWMNIHRMTADTLRILQADHLHPALQRLEGTLHDLQTARQAGANKEIERRYARLSAARQELQAFIDDVSQCADKGAPVTEPSPLTCPPRERDARYNPDLNDGVLVNASGLWPLLYPQWREPKKWWAALSLAKGRKDYDWSRLAMRYWPSRVDEKCRVDPSLGVAHGCFWRYHPKQAAKWEQRLQKEYGSDFRIEEGSYRGDGGDSAHRQAYQRGEACP